MGSVGWEDYTVFGVILAASSTTGIYYGFFGEKQSTTKDYLLAGRSMSSFPVALSLLCSMVSSIALLGYPMEIYLYGTQYLVVVLSFVPLTLSLSYLYIPVFFNLNISSAYEYVEIRFNPGLRLLVSSFSVVHLITLMSIAVYAPSLAIELVTGITSRLTTAVICIVCIFYSTLGGLKAVLWADVLQGLVMLLSLAVIAGKGAVEIGGIKEIWNRMETTGHIEFLNFDPDPRTRHTVWTSVVGGYFVWLPTYAATQLQIQRFLSLPNITRARRAIVMNFIGMFLVVTLCCLTGIVMVAKYGDCDPLMTKEVLKSDQLVPHFAKWSSENAPGLLGLFVSGLTCASMSTLSSGLTALSSVTTYDYVKKLRPKMTDNKLSYVSKLSTLIIGVIVYVFIFAVEQMGSVLPAVTSLSGLLVGPTLGLFTLGMMFPFSTSQGSLCGILLTQGIMVPFTVLQNVYRNSLSSQRLPLSMTGCDADDEGNNSSTVVPSFLQDFQKSAWKEKEDSFGIKALSLSYMWHSAVTCCLTILFGIIFSLLHRAWMNRTGKKIQKVNPNCLSPPVLTLWRWALPKFMEDNLNAVEDDVADTQVKLAHNEEQPLPDILQYNEANQETKIKSTEFSSDFNIEHPKHTYFS